MNSKPLTYDSLKTVILYMDPNTRILLFSRIPSIRTAERAVPLKIDQLLIGSHFIEVNQTTYEYGIYQVDRKDKVPCLMSGRSELNYKWTCNVNEFGMRDYITKAGGMLPGNNGLYERNLFGFHDLENIPTNEGRLQKLKKRLKIEKQRYNQLLNYRPKEKQVSDEKNDSIEFLRFKYYICNQEDATGLFDNEALELLKNEEMVKKGIEHMNEIIKKMENELLPFENKRKNNRPKLEVHVTKEQGFNGPCVIIERVKYTGDLHKAEECLRDFMFSKRRHAVVVNKFNIHKPKCPIQMHRDLKIKIKKLLVMPSLSSNLEIVKQIVDTSSLPLKELIISVDPGDSQQLDFEFIGYFKFVLVAAIASLRLPLFLGIQNQKVNFDYVDDEFLQSGDFLVLIRSWVETNKPIGTIFKFFISDRREETASQILNFVRDGIVHATVGDKCVNIPMRTSSILKISYKCYKFHSTITMRVVPLD
uniref:Doublecortin domain-containing protein n=1 Tax=Caenorhabditis tropicalis TaxID=1561998 RepID=A0A1I7TAJ3_9PELO